MHKEKSTRRDAEQATYTRDVAAYGRWRSPRIGNMSPENGTSADISGTSYFDGKYLRPGCLCKFYLSKNVDALNPASKF